MVEWIVRSMAMRGLVPAPRAAASGSASSPAWRRTAPSPPSLAPRRAGRRSAARRRARRSACLGEARAEGAERRAPDLEADLGDAQVAAAQQRHRALDAPRHQVAVRRLAVREAELAAQVPG